MPDLDVVVLGRVGYDLFAEDLHTPLNRARRFRSYLGGSSANTAIGLSRLGIRVGMISCLGVDALSDYLVEVLAAENVDTRHIQRKAGFLPSLALAEVSPPDQFPQVFYRRDAVDMNLETAPADLEYAASARMFVTNGTSLCASPSRESTYLALECAHEAGARIVFDADYRAMSWRSATEAGLAVRLALPFIDVLIANETELLLVAGEHSLDRAAAKLLGRGVPTVVSKLGSQGTRVYQDGTSIFLPPYPVEVCTTIGAGDGFASGFLYGLLNGLPLEQCLHYGNASAAIVVSRLSCSEAMPTLSEFRELCGRQR